MIFFTTFLLSLFLTITLVPFFRRLAYALHVVDMPGERKVHARPMARTGGLSMAVGTSVSMLLWAPRNSLFPPLMIALLVIVGAGFLDDLKELSPLAKFSAQVLAALIVVLWGGVKIRHCGVLLPEGVLLPDVFAVPLTVFVLVGVTNAINLADGLDGLAGGISVLTFGIIGCLGLLQGDSFVVVTCVAVVGSLFGFLRYNTFPATIFMGDAGSQMLGFLAGVMSLWLTQSNPVLSPFLPLFLLGFPILDTLTVMLERIYRGQSPFKADKNHFHHRLMRFGLFHSEAVLMIYALQLVMVGAAYWLRYYSDWMLLLNYFLLSGTILLAFYILGRRGWKIRIRDKLGRQEFQYHLKKSYQLAQLIKFLFRGLQVILAVVLLLVIMPVDSVPDWLAMMAFVGLLSLLLVCRFRPQWTGVCMRWLFYLIIPALVYLEEPKLGTGEDFLFGWSTLALLTNLAFCVMVVFALLVLRYTRRDGYHSTPMDFLILIVAILAPAVLPREMVGAEIWMVAVKVLSLFFVFEVIWEESRHPNRWLETTVGMALLIIGLKKIWEVCPAIFTGL